MYLEELLGNIRLEDTETEYKERLDRDNPQGWLKTICGFSNASGGIIYVGVEDKSLKLIGFSRREADVERNYLNNQINEHVSPRPDYRIDFLRYEINGRELFIMKVEVSKSEYKPVILKYNGVPSIYMRRSGFTNGATYEEILEMGRRSSTVQYDVIPSDETYDRERFRDLFSFCESRNDGQNTLSDKALASMGFFSADGKLANGAVLFMDGYSGGKTDIHCSTFSGFTRGSERIVSLNRFSGNITSGILFMLDYVRQRMNHSIVKLADSRQNIDAFPERALFEGIINAVAHRDYFMDGTQIEVCIFRDRLEITSPGGFFQRESVKKTYDLTSVISRRRNELISNVLVRCNAMEASGTGFEKIDEEYCSADERHKPFICTESDHFTLVLPDLTYENGVRDSGIPYLEVIPVANGTVHDRKVLEFCYYTARSAKEIAEYLGISDSSFLRKNVLENLVNNQCLDSFAKGRTRYFKTVKDSVRIV